MGKRYNFTKVEKLVSKGKTFSQQPINLFYETQAIQRTGTKKVQRLQQEERKVNALASGAEEGRDKLR